MNLWFMYKCNFDITDSRYRCSERSRFWQTHIFELQPCAFRDGPQGQRQTEGKKNDWILFIWLKISHLIGICQVQLRPSASFVLPWKTAQSNGSCVLPRPMAIRFGSMLNKWAARHWKQWQRLWKTPWWCWCARQRNTSSVQTAELVIIMKIRYRTCI